MKKTKSFFDYSEKEKKRILTDVTRESNKAQWKHIKNAVAREWKEELLHVYEAAASTDDKSDIQCVIEAVAHHKLQWEAEARKEERKRILSWALQEMKNGKDYDRLYEFLHFHIKKEKP